MEPFDAVQALFTLTRSSSSAAISISVRIGWMVPPEVALQQFCTDNALFVEEHLIGLFCFLDELPQGIGIFCGRYDFALFGSP